MPIFKTTDDIRKSLDVAGLSAQADAIVLSTLPCLAFSRRLAQDGPKNMMESRMGGLPAVPSGFEWPHQPALRNAKKRAKEIDNGLAHSLQPMENPFNEDFYRELAKTMSPDEITKFKIEMAEVLDKLEPPTAEAIAQMTQAAEAEKAALFKDFPMAFVGQINLSKLSHLEGFDRALPGQGMLSIFKDTRSWDGTVRVFHFPQDDAPLAHLSVPSELADYVDAVRYANELSWDKKTKCEVLEPYTAISVPHHWGMPHFGDALYEWLQEAEFQFTPEGNTTRRETNFGDQLGGYPEVVQDLPEFELMPKLKTSQVKPGALPWRMVFSYGNEHFGETRQMASSGDGQSYLMMHMDDLARHDFGKVREIYQQT